MKIRLSHDLAVGLDVVTQTLAQIGRKGAGKTYLAGMIAEQMLDAGAQVVILDPVGNWYGLRIGADGKSKGKEIFIIGGEHGDVPVVPEAGARIARLLVEKRVSAIIDISGFRQGERKRFAADFAEEFFHLKKSQRSPVHIFIEEAQKFIPQMSGPEEKRMLGAFEDIVRLGRNYGIGCSLITQRPQSVNKEVLSQVECLCVLQVNGLHERKALEGWIQEAGADRELIGRLPSLRQGEGFVWSPSWLRTFQKVLFNKKTTFDASATPQVGKESKAGQLAPMDVEALRNDLTEVVKSAEAEDPNALRRRIRELETAKPAVINDDLAIARAVEKCRREVTGDLLRFIKERDAVIEQLTKRIERAAHFLAIGAALPAVTPPPTAEELRRGREDRPRSEVTAPPTPAPKREHLSTGGQRILDTIAMLESRGIPISRESVARWMGIHPNGGRYNRDLAILRAEGKLDGFQLGPSELSRSYPFPSGPDGVIQALPDESTRNVFRAILGAGRPLSREELAAILGIHPNGGRFNRSLAWFRTMGVIPERGPIEPTNGAIS